MPPAVCRVFSLVHLVAALFLAVSGGCRTASPLLAVPNDNRTPAGSLSAGVLTLRLEVKQALWHPEGANGIAIGVPTFALEGHAPEVPGPLIRVPSGTRVALRLHNSLSEGTVAIHGFHDRPGHTDQVVTLAPGASTDLTFDAGPPGTFFYWATTTGASTIEDRRGHDGMLTGGIVVDPPASAATPIDDRVFIIGDWSEDGNPHPSEALQSFFAPVINGRSWPATERQTYPVNQPIRWRVINASTENHPMHLHGTYFFIEAEGDESETKPLTGNARPMVVTDVIDSGTTMAITWTPGQPGNWLFHCHILFHIDPTLRMTPEPAAADHDHATGDPVRHMAGLVLGITVLPASGGGETVDAPNPRQFTLEVGQRPGVMFPDPLKPGGTWPGLGYRLLDRTKDAASTPFTSPGPPLVLARGEPVAISIVNHLQKATTVHWHGIELESYYDGVSGFGGTSRQVTPVIQPGATFVARFTPPRAGTFMYHSHLNDYEQLSTGLYGSIVVVDPGARFDPNLDRVFILSRGGPDDDKDPVLINGQEWPEALELRKGVTYRFRFAGITPAPSVTATIRDGHKLLEWRPLAKDGADLIGLRPLTPSTVTVSPGETVDVAFTPMAAGSLRLVAALSRVHTEMALHVK